MLGGVCHFYLGFVGSKLVRQYEYLNAFILARLVLANVVCIGELLKLPVFLKRPPTHDLQAKLHTFTI